MIVLLFIYSTTYYAYKVPTVTEMPSMAACKEAIQTIKNKKFFFEPEMECKKVGK